MATKGKVMFQNDLIWTFFYQ
ncbi:hypothetical protein [Rickettsia canadensis]|nr:hypothetical protein [Rickettsia canadensis]